MKYKIEVTNLFSGNHNGIRRVEKGKSIGAFACNLKPGMKVMANNLTGPYEVEAVVADVGSRIHTPGAGASNYVVVTIETNKI